MMLSRVSFSQRFVILTIVGYLTAVLSAAAAVWLGAAPVLNTWQDQAIREHAESNAQSVHIALREIALKAQHLATNADVVAITVGDGYDQSRVNDILNELQSQDGLVSAYILDSSGSVRVAHHFWDRRSFSGVDHQDIAKALLTGWQQEFLFSYRPGRTEGTSHFLIAQPIRQDALIEGILVTEVSADVEDAFSQAVGGTAQIHTRFQHEILGSGDSENIAVGVEGTDFFVVLRPDRRLLKFVGEELVGRVVYVVGIFLVIPYGLMVLAGLRSIVAPLRALEQSQAALRDNQKQLSELADIAQRSNDAIIATDLDGRITWANSAFGANSGFELDEVIGCRPGSFLHGPNTDSKERERIRQAIKNRLPIRSEILNYKKNGTPYWNAVSIAPQFDENGEAYRFVAISSDITERRKAQDEALQAKALIEHQANHDVLTGLPNRRALETELETLKDSSRERVLIRIDLDHFKNVNDTMGHAAGDHVLCEVSDILRRQIREGDMAARVGGDEFVVLMREGSCREDATFVAGRLLTEIQKDIQFGDKICRIGASFGVASSEGGLLTNANLLQGADAALYSAKEQGRNRVVEYNSDLHKVVVSNRAIAKEIERAIALEEFEPFFQPQFDAKTFEFTGVEALARWRHPTRGVLPPAEFLPIAEQLSIASDLDAMVLRKGLSEIDALNQGGFKIPKISFNVVAGRLEQPDLPDLIHQLSFDDTQISFEVLESVLIEEQSELFRQQVDLLRDIGFGIEVDDFGSGHASVVGLMQLAPDTMKIDQRLVYPITSSPVAMKTVSAVVDIGRALGIGITAEGVETAEHARLLATAGCDTLQGFLFAKPMSASDLRSFMTNYDPVEFRSECYSKKQASTGTH